MQYAGTLQKVYRNTGQNGPYVAVIISAGSGETVRASIFDEWYFEAGSQHDITQFQGQWVEYDAEVTQSKGKQYINISAIQPRGQVWEKPAGGMEQKPGSPLPPMQPPAPSGGSAAGGGPDGGSGGGRAKEVPPVSPDAAGQAWSLVAVRLQQAIDALDELKDAICGLQRLR